MLLVCNTIYQPNCFFHLYHCPLIDEFREFYFPVNFARIVPDGLLVFFPSYYLLDQCISCWKNMVRHHIQIQQFV
jgi:hypothetical protein